MAMIGGSETTSHSLLSCLFFLNKHPETLIRLRKELQDNGFVLGKGLKEKFTIDNIQNLTYLA